MLITLASASNTTTFRGKGGPLLELIHVAVLGTVSTLAILTTITALGCGLFRTLYLINPDMNTMAKKFGPKRQSTQEGPPSVQDRIQTILNELTDAELNILLYEIENPYDEKKESDACVSWELGWRKARQHDYDEND